MSQEIIGALDQFHSNSFSNTPQHQDQNPESVTISENGINFENNPDYPNGENASKPSQNETNRNIFLSDVFAILGLQFMIAAAIVVGVNDLHIFDNHPSVEMRWLTAGIGVSSLALLILLFFQLEGMKKVHYKSVHLGHVIIGLCTLGGAFVASILEMISVRYAILEMTGVRHYGFFSLLITGLSFMCVSLFYRQTKLETSFINLGMVIISNNSGFGIVFYFVSESQYALPICIASIIGMVLTTYVNILCNEMLSPRGCLNPSTPSNDPLAAVVNVYMGIVFAGFVIYSFFMCLFGCPSKLSCCWGKCFCDSQPQSPSSSV